MNQTGASMIAPISVIQHFPNNHWGAYSRSLKFQSSCKGFRFDEDNTPVMNKRSFIGGGQGLPAKPYTPTSTQGPAPPLPAGPPPPQPANPQQDPSTAHAAAWAAYYQVSNGISGCRPDAYLSTQSHKEPLQVQRILPAFNLNHHHYKGYLPRIRPTLMPITAMVLAPNIPPKSRNIILVRRTNPNNLSPDLRSLTDPLRIPRCTLRP